MGGFQWRVTDTISAEGVVLEATFTKWERRVGLRSWCVAVTAWYCLLVAYHADLENPERVVYCASPMGMVRVPIH